jgi:hypothetical protein
MSTSPNKTKSKAAETANAAPARSAAPKAALELEPQAKSEMKTYAGGCHCGKVRYEITADLDKAISCNCSICMKSGSLLTFIPAAQFTLTSGERDLIDYQFNKQVIHHIVCPDCGIKSFARGSGPDGTPTVAVNVRCLDDIDIKALTITEFDGRSL